MERTGAGPAVARGDDVQIPSHAGALSRLPLVVMGDSAGGSLAAVLAQMARDQGGPAIAAQALVYPVTDATMSSQSYAEFAAAPVFSSGDVAWLARWQWC